MDLRQIIEARGMSMSQLARAAGYSTGTIFKANKDGFCSDDVYEAICRVLGEQIKFPHGERPRKKRAPNRHGAKNSGWCCICHAPVWGDEAYCVDCRPEQTRLDRIKLQEADPTEFIPLANAILKQAFDDLQAAKARSGGDHYAEHLEETMKTPYFRSLLWAGTPLEVALQYVEPRRSGRKKPTFRTRRRSTK